MDEQWLQMKINSYLAIGIILVLSSFVAWYSLKAASEIIKVAPNSPTFNVEKRAGAE